MAQQNKIAYIIDWLRVNLNQQQKKVHELDKLYNLIRKKKSFIMAYDKESKTVEVYEIKKE